MDKKSSSRLNLKVNSNKEVFKDDDYETPYNVLKDLEPYIKDYKIIYDPFYFKGTIVEEFKKMDKICLNEKKDAFDRLHPENYDLIFSNIPFSMKKKCFELFFELEKPFIVLTTIDTLGSKWIKKYFDKLQFLIPNGRYTFLKNGEKTKGAWFDTCYVCYNIGLPKDIIKMD